MRITAAIALLCALFTTSAEAKHHRTHPAAAQACVLFCELFQAAPSAQIRVHRARRSAPAAQTEVVEHPAGCPRIAFCGCGAAVKVFGKPIRALWLAANWFRFRRAAPAPGMAAVSRHHVFVLEEHREGSNWLTYDANSGGHLTRVHVRSIAGYTIVNPYSGGV